MMFKGWVSNKDFKSPNRLVLRYVHFLVRTEGGGVGVSAIECWTKPSSVVLLPVFLPAR